MGFYLIKGGLGIVYVGKVSGEQGPFVQEEVSEVNWVKVDKMIGSKNIRPGVKKLLQDYSNNKKLLPTDTITVCF